MRVMDSETTDKTSSGVVSVTRWEQFGLGSLMPFEAMWYTVPPSSCSPRDCHPELELSVVLSGRAFVEIGDTVTTVEQGSAFLLEPDEAHVVHNRSGDGDLVIFSAYWMPAHV